MNLPKPILLLLDVIKLICSLPGLVLLMFRRRRQQVVIDEIEAERLDRIRNPSKYLGKW